MKPVLVAIALLFCGSSAAAGTLTTPAGNQLGWDLPAGWQRITEPPAALLEEIALHIGHDAAKQGKKPSQAQLLQVAAKRLAANELLLYHAQSGAWIGFDFSPLRRGELPPDKQTLELSAGYALESLQNEEEVRGIEAEQQGYPITGVAKTRRLTANYRQHDKPTAFSGLIGYLPGEWFFIYATSYPEVSEQRGAIDALFDSLHFLK